MEDFKNVSERTNLLHQVTSKNRLNSFMRY
jgi:hypothetical protein